MWAMAKVTLSEKAPSELVRFNGWKVDFELGGSAKQSLDTDDRDVIRFAVEHPWLDVEFDAAAVAPPANPNSLAEHPELDAFSGYGPNAGDSLDPEKIKEAEAAKVVDMGDRVALDLSLDQGDKHEVGVVGDTSTATTLASDEDHDAAKSLKAVGVTPSDKPSNDDKKGDA
jgi:hypothetical protein